MNERKLVALAIADDRPGSLETVDAARPNIQYPRVTGYNDHDL